MFRVAVCDDDEQQRDQLRQILLALSFKANIEFEIELFPSGEQLVSHYEQEKSPFHILILDVEMSGINGISVARRIRELQHLDEQIIFLTSYPEYMVESFDVFIFQYLIKPVAPSVLEEKVIRLCRYFQAQEKKFLIVQSGYEDVVLKHDEIIAIESAKSLTVKNKLKFITVSQVVESKGLISKYAESLKDSQFLQIHRSIIINMNHVNKFAGSVVQMSNGLEMPIGRSKIKEVKDFYTKFKVMKDNL
ncbi:DNA-binding response regulator [Paenibacillus sp. J53TS2]|jgi:two-component system, LytTR family, response regulator LytT|uniref:LytR/AlgR family response regulator transcription factor n=1 Tax=unclassified Paenibacillus TaxID=185978 RepID=UPI001B0EC457|nr:LytTR family DNA-binding domain-containing protein [Paenibacillus sp. J53TS2]GIP46923.1 DNA-binding response regulator [Paenibacillus sp. J53TS2]